MSQGVAEKQYGTGGAGNSPILLKETRPPSGTATGANQVVPAEGSPTPGKKDKAVNLELDEAGATPGGHQEEKVEVNVKSDLFFIKKSFIKNVVLNILRSTQ